MDRGIRPIGELINNTGERVVNWLQGEGFRTDRQVADIKASEQYWKLVETLKQKYAIIGEQYIREELIKWEINNNGEVTLIPLTFHAIGELSNKGISIALEAAIQEFDRQLDIDKVIKKLDNEGFFKDTGNVKGGVVVEIIRMGL